MTGQAVRYLDGQSLDLAMLTDEQHYLVDRHARHARRQHGPGIVSGLALVLDGPQRIAVAPGMAIDRNGDDLLLPETAIVDLSGESAPLDVRLLGGDRVPCGRVALVPPDAEGSPPGILLGRIAPDGEAWRRLPMPSPERTALVGQQLRAATGDLDLRFATPAESELPDIAVRRGEIPILTVGQNGIAMGSIEARAGLEVGDGKALRFPATAPAPTPAAAAPWRLGPGAPVAPASGEDDANKDAAKGGSGLELELPRNGRLVIGRAGPDGFTAILSVATNGDTVVRGTLKVGGQVSQAPLPARTDQPRFLAALAEAWQRGTALADGGGAVPLKPSFQDLALDPSRNRLNGRLVLRNDGPAALRDIAVILTADGSGLFEQQRLGFERRLPFLPASRRLAPRAERSMPFALALPEALLRPAREARFSLVATAAFRTKEGASGRATAVAPVTLPNPAPDPESDSA